MKNFIKVLPIIILTITFFSCESESSETIINTSQDPNNSVALSSITINSTWVDYTETINFEADKITDIQFNDGSYHLYSYSGDQVSEIIEYNSNDAILFTKLFSYDGDGKLVQRIITPNTALTEWENYLRYDYTYSEDLIVVAFKQFNFDDVQQGETTFTNLELDQNNIIKSYRIELSLNFRDEATYSNGNPMTYTHYFSGNPVIQSSYEYLNDVAADAYFIEKFKFGGEWRNNMLLNLDQPSLGAYVLDEISLNYLSTLNYNALQSSNSAVTTYSYEFDEDNLLLSQTQTKNSSNFPQALVTLITYEYQ